MKLPFVDERIYESVKFNGGKAITNVTFKYDEDDSTIRGFLGLAKYLQSVVIKKGDDFYIPGDNILFHLKCTS